MSLLLTCVTTPETTGYTAEPLGAEMSTPLWNSKVPPPERTPRRVGAALKIVRGSPKLPRTGCCLSKGLTGQWYDAVASALPEAFEILAICAEADRGQRARHGQSDDGAAPCAAS